MDINLKSLIGKLNDTSRRALESAAGLCLSRSNYDVEIEHWMLKILELDDTDISRLLRYYEIDNSRLTRDLTRAIDRLKTGNTRPPALAPKIVELTQQAWVQASIDFGAPAIRTGHLLLALLSDHDLLRLARESMPDVAKISVDELKQEIRDITAGSIEDVPTGSDEVESGAAARRRRRTGQDAGLGPIHGGPHAARAARAHRPGAGPRFRDSPGRSTSSPGAGRTIRSSPARPASARRPSSKGLPCGSPPATCRRRYATCRSARSISACCRPVPA